MDAEAHRVGDPMLRLTWKHVGSMRWNRLQPVSELVAQDLSPALHRRITACRWLNDPVRAQWAESRSGSRVYGDGYSTPWPNGAD